MWNKHKENHTNAGIEIGLNELIDLRSRAIHSINPVSKAAHLSGVRLTRIRGRGLEFDGTREYQAGDDLRSMAWRVTARSLKPHIKVYCEERERSVWLAVDLSSSLYFGTRRQFKSVRSIKGAALLGWAYLAKRERIGAMLTQGDQVKVYRPQSSERHYLAILNALSDGSRRHPAFSEDHYLLQLLLRLEQEVRSGNLVFILSDFFQFNSKIQQSILSIAKRAQVVLGFVYDPFEAEPPPPYPYVLTNGQKNLLFNMTDEQSRVHYQQQFQIKHQQLIDFTRQHNISLQLFCTDQEE